MNAPGEGKPIPLEEAFEKLFDATAHALPYVERCFEKTKATNPDYFELPKLIQSMVEALDAGRRWRRPK